MNEFIKIPPSSNLDFRQSIYDGAIFLLPANKHSIAFINLVKEQVIDELGEEYRLAHKLYDEDIFFQKIGRLRKLLYTNPNFHSSVNSVIQSVGFELDSQAYDPARLRVVAHNGHLIEAAQPVYYGHRDTWYANHQALITWWLPIHQITPEESFDFFPDYFEEPVANDSEIFDFESWVSNGQEKRIGWQNKNTGKKAGYPSLKQEVTGSIIPVAANAGDILLFSGQHLHKTRKNVTGKTRFSLDFRTVNLEDVKQNRHAKNVDNRSTGSSLVQFIRPKR